ncbi:DUF1800 domain-containing protein [Salinispirillum sp. LH 10-3-1]|uniref:DUF1800 domain-containing protein n=1 Tax=Salinispirillum sp. LH 10-3-1 TaxID=2952525 RepID=A0AB38YDS0_9GAMM
MRLLTTLLLATSLGMLGCMPEEPSKVTDTNYPNLKPNVPALDGAVLALNQPPLVGLQQVSAHDWDEAAVRRVLHLFAFGGHASDAQVSTWASMEDPRHAIEEILYAGPHHPKLSPIEDHRHIGPDGSLQGLSDYWGSNHPANPMRSQRQRYSLGGHADSWRSPTRIWVQASQTRGLNPVRQKLGLYLTNYHMAVSHNANVNNWQMVQYYDDIMNAVAAGKTFDELVTIAASSSAVAVQYNHQWNTAWKDNSGEWHFWGNENFAREYFQLYFGILTSGPNHADPGTFNADYHETISIKNMAALLTGMRLNGNWDHADSRTLSYNTEQHHTDPLEILGHTITGNNALAKMQQLGPLAVRHPQSLENLPVLIVRWLADDEILNKPEKQERLRTWWANLVENDQHDLMTFLKGYAISEDFHSEERIKYFNVFDRTLSIANNLVLTNDDIWAAPNGYRLYDLDWEFWNHGFSVFEPHHNVFGGQTGQDAYKNSDYFMRIFNFVVEYSWRWGRADYRVPQNTGPRVWIKDWRPALPPTDQVDGYSVEMLGEWLWQRFIADDLKNFGPLERAHVYAFLAGDSGYDLIRFWRRDLNLDVEWDEVITDTDLTAGGRYHDPYTALANRTVPALPTAANLSASEQDHLVDFAWRMGSAINFIVSTPYMFYQEGR